MEVPFSPDLESVRQRRVAQLEAKHLWPAVLLDVSSAKQECMWNRLGGLDEDEDDVDREYIAENVEPEQIGKLIDELAIRPDDISAACADVASLHGHFVVFHTGWERFAPRSRDLENPWWAGFHPFLLSPYLVPESARLLSDCGVVGIAIDAFSLEHPTLNSWHTSTSRRDLSDPRLTRDADKAEIYGCLSPSASSWLPLIECLLIPESVLHIPRFIASIANVVASPRRTRVPGVLAVFLIGDSLEHSAIPVRVLFQESPE